MAKPSSRPRPEAPAFTPTTITEITRRYHACALALAKTLGVPLSEAFLQAHRESISCCFIEAGRAGVRLPASVPLPPLLGATGTEAVPSAADDEAPKNGAAAPFSVTTTPPSSDRHDGESVTRVVTSVTAPNGDAPVPATIPTDAGLPCAGQAIAALKPAALAMLVSKVATLAQAEGATWAPLLHALQTERAARLARGQRRVS